MEDSKATLRYAILNKARIYKKSHGRAPNCICLSPLLLKVLVGRQLSKSIQRKQEFLIHHIDEFLLEILCADESLGNGFNFIGRKEELEDYTIDYILLNRYDR